MQQPIATEKRPALPGVIDTIADGFTAVVYQPLFLLPIFMLELYYWLGWSVNPAALGARVSSWLRADNAAAQDLARGAERFAGWDLTEAIAFAVPSLLPDTGGHPVYRRWDRPELVVENALAGGLTLLIVILAGALLFASYAVPIADSATGRARPWRSIPAAVLTAWKRLFGLVLTLAALAALVAAPLIAGWLLFSSQSVEAAPVLAAIASLVGIAAFIVFWFAPDAIVVAEVGPLIALRLSVAVVRAHPQQTMALVAASSLISLGLGEIWQRLTDTPPGLLLAVIANAFFATGLALASMKFFADRFQTSIAAPVSRHGDRPQNP
jgi:hypothetical protein